MALFDLWSHKFKKAEAVIYQQQEIVRFLTLDLIWKPVKKQLRFFLMDTPRGRIILMTSDLTLDPLVALKLYSRRVTIEKFNHIQVIVLGSFQLLACNFNQQICNKARCWLRTSCSDIPSEFVTRSAISNVIRWNLFSFGKDWITQLILEKQNRSNNTGHSQMVA